MNSIEQLEALKQQVIELQEKLNKLTWNDKWEPKGGDWFINGWGTIVNEDSGKDSRIFGTERETKELAEKAAVKMHQFNRLLAYHDEFCPDYEFIARNENYYVYFNEERKIWMHGWSRYERSINIYFPRDIAKELVEKLNSGEVEL